MTGSGSKLAADKLGSGLVNEFKAIASACRPLAAMRGRSSRWGGESSKYLRLSRGEDGAFGIVDYSTNGDCAAGTGSFH